MSEATTAGDKPRSPWIVSPSWDLAYVVGTPLLVLPVVMLLAHRVFSPEQIAMFVVAFASLGHHLPGFMRCYGDRELFKRFRWRFVLAPPVLFIVCATFVFNGLHGLEFMVLFWATWHGLMQTYGFMRIYDLKRGIRDKLTARRDLFLCFMLFTAGLLCSDARVYSIMELFWRTGLPPIDPAWLKIVRIVVVTATALSIAAFLVQEFRLSRSQTGVSWPKILLALTTGLLYWVTGTLSTNMLIGVAMFEVFHAVQYYAIVWIYNRKLADRVGEKSGFIGFLFRGRWMFVGLYLAAIAAFGSIQWFTNSVNDPVVQRLLIACLSASAILHFYYDGFIWKVRERDTQQNFDIAGGSASSPRIAVPALLHVGKCAVLIVIVGVLFGLEQRARARGPEWERELLARLAAWTPNVPELQVRLARQSLDDGDSRKAVELARAAVRRRPRSHEVHAILANAMRHAGRFDEATAHFQTAIDLAPGKWENYHDLAMALVALKQWDEAERNLELASDRNPILYEIEHAWGRFYASKGDLSQAIEHLQAALDNNAYSLPARIDLVRVLSSLNDHDAAIEVAREGVNRSPESTDAHIALGQAYIQAKEFHNAIRPLSNAIRINPNRADAYFQSGLALVQLGNEKAAIVALRQALSLDADNADAHFQLGNALYLVGDVQGAADSFRKCFELNPKNINACNSLGSMLIELGDWEEARELCGKALVLNPNQAETHYNLGLLCLQEKDTDQARNQFLRAWQLGITPSPEIIAELGLTQPVTTGSGS